MAQKLGKYRVIKRLALGGISEIFLAIEEQGRSVLSPLNRKVIIKKLLPQYTQEPRMRKLIHYEARLLAALNHANIVQVYDAGVDAQGESYLVQEFIDGTDLKAFYTIAREMGESISPPILFYITEQVLRALVHVHELCDAKGNPYNLIHRDLSPTNIMVSMSGDVKLLDFGLAKRSVDITSSGNIAGKIPYMAPEQFEGMRVDSRIDIFALGSVLYELTTGLHRFNGSSDVEIMSRIRGRQEQPLNTIARTLPTGMIRIFMKAMVYDRDLRYQSAREMLGDLSRLPNEYPSLHRGRELLQDFMEYNFGATKIDASFMESEQEISLISPLEQESMRMPLLAGEMNALEEELNECETVIYREESPPAPPPAPRGIPQPPPPAAAPAGYAPGRSTTETAVPGEVTALPASGLMQKAMGWSLGLLVLCAVAITGWLFLKGGSQKPEKQILVLNGNYSNNQVFFDQRPHCKLPCMVTIPPDDKAHEIRVEAPGFFPWVKKLRAGEYPEKELAITMRRYLLELDLQSDYGNIEVALIPPGRRPSRLTYVHLPVLIKELRPNSLLKLSVKWRRKRRDLTITLPEKHYFSYKLDPTALFGPKR